MLETSINEFAVYLHWPFCAAKCPYCDFNSHVRFAPPDEERYINAFQQELTYFRERTGKKELTSLFFGGGTPSLMKAQTVERLIRIVTDLWPASPEIEITLEANPTSVEADRFRSYRQAGINRVSLGVQSLNDTDLKFLGRLHSAEEARKAIKIARDNFPRFTFDLIYARPEQSLEAWRDELNRAFAEGSKHLSLYQLTIEEGTPFAALHKAGKFIMPNEDTSRAFYDLTQEMCEKAGLPAYEISNHAAIGEESRHNITYWRMGDYVGSGAGAHGRISNQISRHATSCIKSPEKWIESVEKHGHGLDSNEALSHEEVADEYLLMGLRLKEGIDISRFERLSAYPLNLERMKDLIENDMIWLKNGRLGVTKEGFPVLDAVVADIAMA